MTPVSNSVTLFHIALRYIVYSVLLGVMLVAIPNEAAAFSIVYPANGVYSLQPEVAPGMELAVTNYSRNKGANAVILPINSNWQKWRITRLSNNAEWYKIEAVHSGLALDVDLAKSEDGTSIATWPYGNVQNQFRFFDAGNGYYIIQANVGGVHVLDVSGGNTASGTPVHSWSFNDTASQKWKLVPAASGTSYQPSAGSENVVTLSNGWYSISPSHATNLVLDAAGAGTASGTNLQVWSNGNQNQQNFTLKIAATDFSR